MGVYKTLDDTNKFFFVCDFCRLRKYSDRYDTYKEAENNEKQHINLKHSK